MILARQTASAGDHSTGDHFTPNSPHYRKCQPPLIYGHAVLIFDSQLKRTMPSYIMPTLSRSNLVVDVQDVSPPVTYLCVLLATGVLLCTKHRCCYTLDNYHEHLKRAHGVKGLFKKRI